MCSRNDDPTQIDPPYKWPEKERDRFLTGFDEFLDTRLSAEECEKIMQESEGRSCANPQEHAFVHVYPPVAKIEEELEELTPEIKAIREWDDLNRLRYVHGGDLHYCDWKCHA